MVTRFATVVREVSEQVERELAGAKPVPQPVPTADAQ
jgi:hypothetical protein